MEFSTVFLCITSRWHLTLSSIVVYCNCKTHKKYMINPKFKDERTEEEKKTSEKMAQEFVDGLNKSVDERDSE